MNQNETAKKIAARWLDKTATAQSEFRWGMNKLRNALSEIDDVRDLWIIRQDSPQGVMEGFESLADIYGEINQGIQNLKPISEKLFRVIQNLEKVRIQKAAAFDKSTEFMLKRIKEVEKLVDARLILAVLMTTTNKPLNMADMTPQKLRADIKKAIVKVKADTPAIVAEARKLGLMDPAPVDRTSAREKKQRIAPSLKKNIARTLAKNGLDGNGRFAEPQEGFRKALDVLGHFGIVLTDLVDAHRFVGDEGRFTEELGTPSQETFMPPIPIDGSRFVMSFYKRGEENFEVLVYLS